MTVPKAGGEFLAAGAEYLGVVRRAVALATRPVAHAVVEAAQHVGGVAEPVGSTRGIQWRRLAATPSLKSIKNEPDFITIFDQN